MLWRILVFYIGAIFVIAAVVPVGSAGLKSPFGFSWLTCFGLVILAATYTVGFIGGDSRPQLLSTLHWWRSW
ncbi:hypothetical protein V9L18_21925 [Pseudarthrobacter sp. CCNWLW217]